MTKDEQWLINHGYKLVTREEFVRATDLPEGLAKRAEEYTGAFVVYDPEDDDEGFMIVRDGPREQVAKEACEHLA